MEVSQLSRSTYYYRKKAKECSDKYEKTKKKITEIYHAHKGRYGYRRITQLLKNLGYLINHKTVLRLMRELSLKSIVRRKKYRSYKGETGKIADNIIKRNFTAARPNQKWVTDITEVALCGKKVYLSPILDLYNREIVAYTLSERPVLQQVMTMLKKAFAKNPKVNNLILHSDQGWQYQHKTYQKELKNKHVRQSMSRKGNCLDNAVMENFFGILKSEFFYTQEFTDLEHFKQELKKYIYYYNHKRIKLKLKGLSPVQYRTQSL